MTSYPFAHSLHHRAIRAEMRALQLTRPVPVPAILMSLLAAASAASAFLTLASL